MILQHFSLNGLVRNTVLVAIFRASGLCFTFIFNVIVARQLGADGAGVYFLSLAIVSIFSVLGRLGLDNAMLKLIAKYATENSWGNVSIIFKYGLYAAGICSTILGVVLFIYSDFISTVIFRKDELSLSLKVFAFAVVFYSGMRLVAESLRGLNRSTASIITSDVILPFCAIILIFPASQIGGATGAGLAYVFSTIIAFLVGCSFWLKFFKGQQGEVLGRPRQELYASSKPLFLMSIMTRAIQPWVPLLLLGFWSSAEETGIYGVVLRLSMLTQFLTVALNISVAPKIVALHVRKDVEGIGILTRKTAFLVTLASCPVYFIMTYFGADVLRIFGEDFSEGHLILVVAVVGQVSNSLTGSVGYVLIMTGHEKDIRNLSVVSTILLIAFCTMLIPLYGALGAAIASGVAFLIRNVLLVIYAYRRLGINTLPIPLNLTHFASGTK